ncbi:MAG: CheR family methyltransferase [Bacteroidales bacterium]
MHETEIRTIEIDLLLEALYKRFGYDFRDYTRPMLERRIDNFQNDSSILSLSELISRVLREPTLFYNLISYFSINVTSLFRDPFFYASFREHVVPMLRTWAHNKIWDAGCATGEEVYSLAILLHEEGMFERSTIYATDINASALETAKTGIYPLKIIQHGSLNYIESGAHASFSDYYFAQYNAAKIDARFSNNITFAKHNLTTDESFGEMQAIVCRNVLIYFNSSLQNRILKLFWESLDYGGFLCLGDKETIAHTSVEDKFEIIDSKAKIYKKRI